MGYFKSLLILFVLSRGNLGKASQIFCILMVLLMN